MSCFIVEPKTIAYISNYIADHINNGFNNTRLCVEISDDFKKMVCNNYGYAEPRLIYKKLYLLNWQAYETRYEYRHKENLDLCSEYMQEFEKYDTTLHKYNVDDTVQNWQYQMLKSLECYLYQCAESAELENSIIYKTVNAMKNALMCYIVHNADEYNRAEWR